MVAESFEYALSFLNEVVRPTYRENDYIKHLRWVYRKDELTVDLNKTAVYAEGGS